jgi:hypothetical protein
MKKSEGGERMNKKILMLTLMLLAMLTLSIIPVQAAPKTKATFTFDIIMWGTKGAELKFWITKDDLYNSILQFKGGGCLGEPPIPELPLPFVIPPSLVPSGGIVLNINDGESTMTGSIETFGITQTWSYETGHGTGIENFIWTFPDGTIEGTYNYMGFTPPSAGVGGIDLTSGNIVGHGTGIYAGAKVNAKITGGVVTYFLIDDPLDPDGVIFVNIQEGEGTIMGLP